MPFVFTLKSDAGTVYRGLLKPAVCEALNPDGEKCGEDCTLHIEYCAAHLRSLLALEVKKATDPKMGLGLFAVGTESEVVFSKRGNGKPHRVVSYKGQVLTRERCVERYGLNFAPFAMHLTNSLVIDPALFRGVASYMNHSGEKANCKYVKSKSGVHIEALRLIRGGEELFANYHPTKKGSLDARYSTEFVEELDVYCYCQKTDDGKLYVECSGKECWHAKKWVHAECAGLEKVPETFYCDDCAHRERSEGVRITTPKILARHFMLEGHAAMAFDAVRNEAFKKALDYVVKKGARSCFDVGTGPTAFLSVLAADRGMRVGGIEADAVAARSAHKILRARGGFVRHLVAQDAEARALVLEFKPDVVVCELIGFLASGEGMPVALASIQKACGGSGASFLPSVFATRFTLGFCPRESREDKFTLFRRLNFDKFSLSLSTSELEVFDCSKNLQPQLLQERKCAPLVNGRGGGVVNSLAFYIEAEFLGGARFTSRALTKDSATNWRNLVLWLPHELEVRSGDVVEVESTVDARQFPSKYAFKIVHTSRGRPVSTQHVRLDDLF
jgi:hypothetical protein